MSTPLNYATQYSKALAQAYPHVLAFGDLWVNENKAKYKVVDAKTIKIPKLKVGGRQDGDRDTIGGFKRNFSNEWETKELKNHRTWNTLVHPMDIDQTNQVASIANITEVFNTEEKFPEMDAMTIHFLFDAKNTLEAVTHEVTADGKAILAKFDELMDKMDEARVPQVGRKLYVDTYTKTLLDSAIAITRANGDQALMRSVSRIDNVDVKSVPTDTMKSKYVFDNNGFRSAEDAKDVAMMLVHPSCIIPCVNYDFVGLEAPSVHSQGKYLYFEESFEDIFLLNARHDAIQFVLKPASVMSAMSVKEEAQVAKNVAVDLAEFDEVAEDEVPAVKPTSKRGAK